MKEGFYVDELVNGCNNVEEPFNLYQKAVIILKERGFRVLKFKTNNKKLICKIQEREKECEMETCHDVSEQC